MKKTVLREYARLIVRSGVNVQKGQEVLIYADLDQPEFVQLVVEEAYKAKAKKVCVEWNYQPLTKLHTRFRSVTTLGTVEEWEKARQQHYVDVLPARIHLISEDPDGLKGINMEKLSKARRMSYPVLAERCHPADASLSLHTIGTRLFGRPVSLIEYSLEGARQFGRDANGNHLAGEMVDGRLLLHLADYLPLTPVLTFNATHFSGDKPGSNRNEGWQPLHTQCPLWGEELIPIMINGNWTNLQALKLEAAVNPVKPVRLALSATQYLADENGGNLRSNTGDNFGLLLSTALSYKFSDHLAFLFQLSHFNPGDYFADGHKSIWGRFEVTLAF